MIILNRIDRILRESGLTGLLLRPPVRLGIQLCNGISEALRRSLAAVPSRWLTPANVARRLAPNSALRGKHRGERCVILGNGPSLARTDLSCISGTPLFTCNQGYLFSEERGLKPTYHAMVDVLFAQPEYRDMLAEVISLQAVHGTVFLTGTEVADALLAVKPDLAVFQTHQFLMTDYVTRRTDRLPDLTESQFGFLSVIHLAIHFALYMEFKEIILLGCDMDFFLDPEKPFVHSYGVGRFGEPGKSAKELFDREPLGLMEWCVREFRGFDELRRLAEAQGCRIINAGTGGALTIFERASLPDLFGSGDAS